MEKVGATFIYIYLKMNADLRSRDRGSARPARGRGRPRPAIRAAQRSTRPRALCLPASSSGPLQAGLPEADYLGALDDTILRPAPRIIRRLIDHSVTFT